MLLAGLPQASSNQLQSFFPARFLQALASANQRTRQALITVCEVEGVTTLDAEEVAVDPALVAIIAAHDLQAGFMAAHTQRGLAAVAAVRAGGAHVLHLPRARLVAISARGQCAHRTNINAHAAFFALQMIFLVGRDNGGGAAV